MRSQFASRAENLGHEDIEYFAEQDEDYEGEDAEGDTEGYSEDESSDTEDYEADGEDYESDSEDYEADTSEADAAPGERQQFRMDMRRAAARERDLAGQQRAAAQRASAAQAALNQRLQDVAVPSPLSDPRFDIPGGTGIVTAQLPNGRTTQLMITPQIATRRDLGTLMRQVSASDLRQARAIRMQGKAIQRLKATQSAAVKVLTAQQLKMGKDLAKRMAASDAEIDKRISKTGIGQSKALKQDDQRLVRALQRQKQRSTWNLILLATALPFYAAYSNRASLLSRNNVILTGSLAVGLLGDDAIESFLGESNGSKAVRGGVTAWSYLAPLVYGGLMFYLLDKGQNERFVAGVAPLDVAAGATFLGTGNFSVARDYMDDFAKRKPESIPVFATILDAGTTTATSVTAEVDKDDKTKINFILVGKGASLTAGKALVSFVVDTKAV